jgi:nitrogen fixation protein
MSKIGQWVKRRFKELDYLEEYFPLVFTRWQAALWGGSVLAVAFGWRFITSDWPPYVKLTACIVALFFAGYYIWRADHVRLKQRIAVTKVIPQSWEDKTTGREAIAYYFEVLNESEALTIHGVRVQLEKIEPEVENLTWLPVPLQQKHDNPILGAVHVPAREFYLNPNEHKHIDFVSAFYGAGYFCIHHVAGAAVNQYVPSGQTYHLKVMVTAQDMPKLSKWFGVWMNESGVLQCEME